MSFSRVRRSWDLDKRKRYVKLVDSVRDNGGDVKIFSSLHVSGERKCTCTFRASLVNGFCCL